MKSSPASEGMHDAVARNYQYQLKDLELQNSATWRTLDAASQHRDLLVLVHGALVGLAPVLLKDQDVLTALLLFTAALVFLLLVASVGFAELEYHRELQFKVDAASHYAMQLLTLEGPAPYWGSSTGPRRLPPLTSRWISRTVEQLLLRRTPAPRSWQKDPMAAVVRTGRMFVLLDAAAVAALLCADVEHLAGMSLGSLVSIMLMAASAAAGFGVAVAASERFLRASQLETERDINRLEEHNRAALESARRSL